MYLHFKYINRTIFTLVKYIIYTYAWLLHAYPYTSLKYIHDKMIKKGSVKYHVPVPNVPAILIREIHKSKQ